MDEIVFEVIIGRNPRGFFLRPQEEGTAFLVIPDCGGMADMVPRHPDQLEWLEPRMETIANAERVWPTVWKLTTPQAVSETKEMLVREGKLSLKLAVEFY